MENHNQTLQFCRALLGLGHSRSRAMANFVMSLASSPSVHHPVELSAGEFCHYHYSNLPKVLRHWRVSTAEVQRFVRPFIPAARTGSGGLQYYALTHDVSKMLKAHSPCLEGRQYVPTSNNVISGNRSIGVGYVLSALHLSASESGWCPPLALERLSVEDDLTAVAVRQIQALLQDVQLPFSEALCVLRADTAYGKASFLAPLYQLDHLVLIVRLRAGMRVWEPAEDSDPNGGARQVYGTKRYLLDASRKKTYHKKGVPYQVWQPALSELPEDESLQQQIVLGNGRKAILDIRRWNNLLLRSKKGACMKHKPLDILRVMIVDAHSHQPIFERPLFLAVCGKRKNCIDCAQAREEYRQRYDVEPYYRFAKNRLLLDKLQTPIAQHLDPWLRIVQLASWLLFTARQQVQAVQCPVWQKYLPKNKAVQNQLNPTLTIAQTQRSLNLLFRTFDAHAFLPLKSKKGAGRKIGQTFPQRTRYRVLKKVKKPIRKLKNQYDE